MKQIKRNVALTLTLVLTVACMWSEGLTAMAAPVFSVPAPTVSWTSIKEAVVKAEAITVSTSDVIEWDELMIWLYDNDDNVIGWNGASLNGGSYSNTFDGTEYINESGTYTVEVLHAASVTVSGNEKPDVKGVSVSAQLTYNHPGVSLSTSTVWWDADGTINWSIVKDDYAYAYSFTLYRDGVFVGEGYADNNYVVNGVEYDYFYDDNYKNNMTIPGIYTVELRVLSSDIEKMGNSDLGYAGEYKVYASGDVEYEDNAPADEGDGTSSNTSSSSWSPSTAEDKERFSYKGSMPVSFTASNAGDYKVVQVMGDVQGQKFFDSIETVLGSYKVGCTLSVVLDYQKLYNIENQITITMKIPEQVKAEGRTYIMIGVDKDGVPYVQKDLDTNPDTITFEVDKGYAYALCYLDAQ